MMPVYFHLQSHLWIVYLFFVNGLLIHGLCRCYSKHYSEMTQSLEASFLAAFFLSIGLNASLLLLLDVIGENFTSMRFILPCVSLGLLFLLFMADWKQLNASSKMDFSYYRLAIYAFIFVVLFYNGGLIEQISDAWWHMSLANKIGLESTFKPALGHLTGASTRYYPPLWHANLALARTMSDTSIPIFWNSLTSWIGILKVMGFYLVAYSLTKKNVVATLSALLFCLLPGLGDSYFRVSAWPSHIAYAAMFAQFYVGFWIVDNYQTRQTNVLSSLMFNLLKLRCAVFAFLFLSIVMLFAHQLELFLFYCGITFYLAAITVYRLLGKQSTRLADPQSELLFFLSGGVFLIGLGASVFGLYDDWSAIENDLDRLTVGFFFPVVFLLLFSFLFINRLNSKNSKTLIWVFLTVIVLLVLVSIDTRQVLALFLPDLAYPRNGVNEAPHIITGLLGGELKLPGWHMQLRSALLYTGIISIPISIVIAFIRPTRATIFLCSNAIIVILFSLSPYFYQWLASILNYHSPWRITTLLFHPIIIAMALHMAWEYFRRGVSK